MDTVFRLSFAILGDEADARDAAQDTFVTAWRQIGRLREVSVAIDDAQARRLCPNGGRGRRGLGLRSIKNLKGHIESPRRG